MQRARIEQTMLEMGVESGWSKRGVVTDPARSRRPCRYLGSYLPPRARFYTEYVKEVLLPRWLE
jgi:hypothetical protein